MKIGYPDKWKDYTTMAIDPKLSYYENMHNVSMWHQKEELAKWGKPVDKTEWGMTPQTINAYYNPLANEIVFPAGILQAPFFDPEASDAENYGAIGVVIGHEMAHGFDDQGCNFDAEGNMVNWWTPEDAEAFAKMTQGLVGQFNEVEVLPGLHANGQYTLGENIADQGGLRVARTAFLDAQKKKGVDINSEEAKIDGIDPMKVFYLNYANIWAQNIRPEEIRSLTTGDVHSLGEHRVNVTLRNIQPFFDAFGIKKGARWSRQWRRHRRGDGVFSYNACNVYPGGASFYDISYDDVHTYPHKSLLYRRHSSRPDHCFRLSLSRWESASRPMTSRHVCVHASELCGSVLPPFYNTLLNDAQDIQLRRHSSNHHRRHHRNNNGEEFRPEQAAMDYIHGGEAPEAKTSSVDKRRNSY